MDPDANLKEQRELTREILAIFDAADPDTGKFTRDQEAQLVAKAVELAERAEALDTWIVKGGFLPERWRKSE